MTSGQKLRGLVFKMLDSNKAQLSMSQRMTVEDNEGGTHEPADSEAFLAQVIRLKVAKNWAELVQVYKKLPAPPREARITFLIDYEGEGVFVECGKTTFNNSDDILGVRKIEGKNAPSAETNTTWMTTGDRPDSPYSKGMHAKNSIMKNATRGSGEFSSDHERM